MAIALGTIRNICSTTAFFDYVLVYFQIFSASIFLEMKLIVFIQEETHLSISRHALLVQNWLISACDTNDICYIVHPSGKRNQISSYAIPAHSRANFNEKYLSIACHTELRMRCPISNT